MTTTAAMGYEERQEQARRFARLIVYGLATPIEPMATRAQVLEVPCATCGAETAHECEAGSLRPSFLGRAFPGLRGIHARRYLDRTGDPR